MKPKTPSPYTIRLDPELREKLEALAAAERRSLSNTIQAILWDRVEQGEKQKKGH